MEGRCGKDGDESRARVGRGPEACAGAGWDAARGARVRRKCASGVERGWTRRLGRRGTAVRGAGGIPRANGANLDGGRASPDTVWSRARRARGRGSWAARTSRKNCLERAFASERLAEKTGAPAARAQTLASRQPRERAPQRHDDGCCPRVLLRFSRRLKRDSRASRTADGCLSPGTGPSRTFRRCTATNPRVESGVLAPRGEPFPVTRVATIGPAAKNQSADRRIAIDLSRPAAVCVWRTDRSWLPRGVDSRGPPTPTCARGSRAFARDERVGIFPSAGAHPFPDRLPLPPAAVTRSSIQPLFSPRRFAFHPPAPTPLVEIPPQTALSPRSIPFTRVSGIRWRRAPRVIPQPRRLRRPRRPVHPRVRAQRHAEPLGPDEPSRRRRRPRLPAVSAAAAGSTPRAASAAVFPASP